VTELTGLYSRNDDSHFYRLYRIIKDLPGKLNLFHILPSENVNFKGYKVLPPIMNQYVMTLTDEQRARIIASYFRGLGRDETATLCKNSGGAVTKIWKEVEETIGSEGKRLRDLAIQLRRDDHTVTEAIRGSEIVRNLLKIGVDSSKMESFTDVLYKRSIESGRSAEAVVDAAIKLIDIEEESRLDYESIPLIAKEKADELAGCKQELIDIKSQIKDARAKEQAALSDKDTTMENLERYVKVKEGLKIFGLELDSETESSANTFSNLREHDYDIQSVLRQAGNHKSLSKENVDLENNIEIHTAEDQRLQLSVEKNKEILSELNRVKKLGVSPDKLKELSQILIKIGTTSNLSPDEVTDRFFEDLKGFDEKVGFGYQVDKTKVELQTLQSKRNSEQSTLEELHKKIAEDQGVFNIIKSLMKKGVQRNSLISWEKALAKAGVRIEDFNSQVNNFGDLSLTINHLENKISKLEGEEKRRKARIRTLKDEESNVKESIRAREEIFASSMRGFEKKAISALEKVESQAISRVNEANEARSKFEDDMVNHSKEIGKLQAIRPMLDLVNGEQGTDPLQLGVMMVLILHKYKAMLGGDNNYRTLSLRSSLESAIRDIEDRDSGIGNW